MQSAILFTKYLSCETNIIVPLYSFSIFSRVSFPTMSMWFVGSSSNNKLGPFLNISHNCNLPFSPPDSIFIFLKTSSPVNKNEPKIVLICVVVRFGNFL